MAQRYRAILRLRGHNVGGEDSGVLSGFSLKMADAVIVATPTETHGAILRKLKDCGKPILCEKPLSTCLAEVEATLDELAAAKTNLVMVSQYDYLVDPAADGPTHYDYFKSGRDGLAWDCVNVIKHAKGTIRLGNKSPFWDCVINGKRLNIRDMDYAYAQMIDDWTAGKLKPDFDAVREAHHKVSAYIEANDL